MKVKCLDCGEYFEITEGEKEFFKSKNFDLPKRCRPCRQKRKLARIKEEVKTE